MNHTQLSQPCLRWHSIHRISHLSEVHDLCSEAPRGLPDMRLDEENG